MSLELIWRQGILSKKSLKTFLNPLQITIELALVRMKFIEKDHTDRLIGQKEQEKIEREHEENEQECQYELERLKLTQAADA